MEIEQFLYYLCYEIQIILYMDQYYPKYKYQRFYDTRIFISYNMGETLWQLFTFIELDSLFYYFVFTNTLNIFGEKLGLV